MDASHSVAKVADFGISRVNMETDSVHTMHSTTGTIAYCAPEVIRADKEGYDQTIDVYSLSSVVRIHTLAHSLCIIYLFYRYGVLLNEVCFLFLSLIV